MILTDNETKIDLLNNEAITTTIISMLREKRVRGIWGARMPRVPLGW
jgi:phage tail sheath protein FI